MAGEALYHFIWDDLASTYLESIKSRADQLTAITIFVKVYKESLKMLHPFMPFITECIWEFMPKRSSENEILALEKYPEKI